MNDYGIKDVISDRFKNIKKYCKRISRKFAAKDIHGFRTEVKKLRAYIRLVTSGTDDSQHYKLPKKFKGIYSTAGAVRDIQLQLERIKTVTQHEARQPEQYEALLKKKMKKKKQQLKKRLAQTSIRSIEKKVLAHLPMHFDLETIRNFVRAKTTEIRFLTGKKDEQDDDIHSIRKNLKDLMYNVKSMQHVYLVEAFPAGLSDAGKLKSVEQLTDHLGMFTDMTAALSFTEPSYLEGIDDNEKLQLQGVRDKWIEEKNKLRQRAINDIHAQTFISDE